MNGLLQTGRDRIDAPLLAGDADGVYFNAIVDGLNRELVHSRRGIRESQSLVDAGVGFVMQQISPQPSPFGDFVSALCPPGSVVQTITEAIRRTSWVYRSAVFYKQLDVGGFTRLESIADGCRVSCI